ncbi:unnamed protein product (macronuclear) [Paramecium tetraurelia]|uniref:Protein kinase domain-containing protein n=1 Tax=Paramecium tetraurelia TaxID=5888 RepID=A0CIA3_PARTE|nr:uncharacterized protein GSPATT00007655001 [Paramecium tetraurelia]CAK70520.1 unnamed protein product [Paramecium tetraurelia]|eukprot:XP_001437917.1 hypothetical protein (macronuclear) [Paramecium tetraurelia strain d4-2]
MDKQGSEMRCHFFGYDSNFIGYYEKRNYNKFNAFCLLVLQNKNMIQSQPQQSQFQRRMQKIKGFLNSESNFSPVEETIERKTRTPLLTQQQMQSSDLSDHDTHSNNVENNQIGLKNNCFLDEYTLGEKLGEGTNGIVWLCWPKKDDQTKYAVKVIPTDDEEIISMVKQAFINSQLLKSPFIAKCYKLFIEQTKLYLLMEWVPCSNLETLLKQNQKLKEKHVQQIALTLLKAVKCLHKAGVCHRDIKPDNIQVCTDYKIKLIDFGVSRRFVTINQNTLRYNRNKMMTITGNIHYRAPEIYRDYGYDSQVDLWAIGVVIYQCLTGILPYTSEYTGDLIEILSQREPSLDPFHKQVFLDLPTSCRDFIKRLMMWNPLKRLNASEALRHIWVPSYTFPNKIKIVKDDIDVSKSSQNSDLYNKTLINSAMILNQELANTLLKSRRFDAIQEEDTPKEMNKSLEVSINACSYNQDSLKQRLEQFKLLSSTQIHQRMGNKKETIKYINTITIFESENSISDFNSGMETSINVRNLQVQTSGKNVKDLFGLNLCESQVSLTQIDDIMPENNIQQLQSKQIDADLLQQLTQFEQ